MLLLLPPTTRPCFTIDTACSSTVVALDCGSQALRINNNNTNNANTHNTSTIHATDNHNDNGNYHNTTANTNSTYTSNTNNNDTDDNSQALRIGRCKYAVASGVNIQLSAINYYYYYYYSYYCYYNY